MPTTKVNQYGLLEEEGPSSNPAAGIAQTGGGNPQSSINPTQTNPFAGRAPTLSAAGAQAVIPEVQQFAFNPNYAAQSQALDRLLATKDQERGNALSALDQNWQRQRGEAETTRAKTLDSMIGKYAGTGLLWSTIDAGQRTDLQNNFSKFLGDLDINRANSQQDIHRGYGQLIGDVNAERARMWGSQQKEEEAARIKAEDDRRAAEAAQRQADENRRNAEMQAQAARDAAAIAAANRPAPPTAPTAGGGGGGAGWGSAEAAAAGINAGMPLADILTRIDQLTKIGGIHELSVLYNAPELNQPAMLELKKGIGKFIYNASTPGQPGYIPSPTTPSYAPPGYGPGGAW